MFSLKQSSSVQNYEDFKYLNINIINSKQSSSNFFQNNPQIAYSNSFPSPVVDNAKNYVMSISSFTSSCGSCLPVWSPEIVDNQPNPNLCVQNITMTVNVGGSIYSQTTNMSYVSENASAQAPSNTMLSMDSQHYYYAYSMSHVAYLFNNMLQTCYNALQAQVGGSFSFQNVCPFMMYDPTTGLFSLYFDQAGDQFNVFFDNNLYNMFYSFYFQNTNQLVINKYNGVNNVVVGSHTFTKVTQDFVSTASWSPVLSLVFTTSLIPINPEITTLPNQYYDETNMSNSTQNPVKQKIITDFNIPYDKATDARGYITYTPTVLRWISLNSQSPIYDIDISLFFIDKNSGNLVPVLMPNNSSCKLKLEFKRINNL